MKNLYALLLGLTLTVFALGCITPDVSQTTTTQTPATLSTLPPQATLSPAVQKEVETLKTAINTNNADDCDKVESKLKDLCYRQLGMKNSDPNLCMKISETSQRDMCINRVAMSKKDKSICAKITDFATRQGCENRA